MEEKGSLGIYLAPDKAVAVWISSGGEASVLHKFAVAPNAEEPAAMATQAARAAARAGFAFDEVFAAVDCSYFTQYNLTSEFDDYRQIDSTIKFDVEEAAAADAVNLAVAFEITGKESVGSAVTVYTADRQRLTDILLDLQEGGLDPTVIEPDIVTLTRSLTQTAGFAERTDALFIVLSEKNCYMLRPQTGFAPIVRTFFLPAGDAAENALAREILLARASTESKNPINAIVLIGNMRGIDSAHIAERTGLKVTAESPEKSLVRSMIPDDQIACHELLIAYGAALAARNRAGRVDFRHDFMPYQGQRRVMEGSLRVISISMTVLLLAIGIFFLSRTLRMRGYAGRVEENNVAEYKAVMFGKNPPAAPRMPSSALKTEYTRVKNIEDGIGLGDDKSIPARLTFFLEAVNSTPANVDIVIQQITVTSRSMKVKGDTNSQPGTMALLNEIKKHPRIALGSERIAADGSRYVFEITIDSKTDSRK